MIPRRALLAAGTGLALPALPAAAREPRRAATAPPLLRERLGTLGYGANLERWYPVARDNQPRRLGRGWWQTLRGVGFDHVRMFMPEVRVTGDSPELIRLYLQAVRDAADAGLVVLFGIADTLHHSTPWRDEDWRAFAARLRVFGAETDPQRVALAPLNEAAFPDTATWVPVRDRLLGQVRGGAPGHVLLWGGREWSSVASLLEMPLPADANTVAEVHDYAGGTAAEVARRFTPVAEWRDRLRTPVLVSEFSGPRAHAENRALWTADLRQALPVLRRLRLPVTLWSYSHGGWWRLQDGDTPQPVPEVALLLR